MKKLLFVICTFFYVLGTYSQDQSSSYISGKANLLILTQGEEDFNFWLGEWKLIWKNKSGDNFYGRNSIKTIAGGKVIHELFTQDIGKYSGTSISMYDETQKLWKQTWMDNHGTELNFNSKPHTDLKIFETTKPDEKGNIFRMVFKDIRKNSFTWEWQSSSDEGRSWTTNWKIWYERMHQ